MRGFSAISLGAVFCTQFIRRSGRVSQNIWDEPYWYLFTAIIVPKCISISLHEQVSDDDFASEVGNFPILEVV